MISEKEFTVEDFRKRIQTLSDEKLIRYAKAARYMADPRNSTDSGQVKARGVTATKPIEVSALLFVRLRGRRWRRC
jgi:hypothetical protein